MATYDIPTLERLLDNEELSDAEAHKLYNNLGLAHAAAHNYRAALRAHRDEKRACKRLVSAASPPVPPALLVDLAIAYRLCGDVMLKHTRLRDARNNLLTTRAEVFRAAREQHARGLHIARAVVGGGLAAQVEVQAACAAVAQSALAIALETRDPMHFRQATFSCVEAALYATKLPVGTHGVPAAARDSMLLGTTVNIAIALSGVGLKHSTRQLLYRVAIDARKAGDDKNLVRAVSNLAEEAGEEGDLELCERFVNEWIRLARKHDDEADEADALRKLASVLVDRDRYEEAKVALDRSLVLAATSAAQEEARAFLIVVESELQSRATAKADLARLEKQANEYARDRAYVDEAKARHRAGECAHVIRAFPDVVKQLERYFVLVDEYGCNTGVTDIPEGAHATAVANMGESLWILKRYGEAVNWATRELTVYSDDVPGQAQAWCNLGVYLDDFGKKDNAIIALQKSCELAEKCGQSGILKRAKDNLALVLALSDDDDEAEEGGNEIGKKSNARHQKAVGEIIAPAIAVISSVKPLEEAPSGDASARARIVTANQSPLRDLNTGGEKSVIIDSTQPLEKVSSGAVTDCSQGIASKAGRRDRTTGHTSGTTKETAVLRESRDADLSRSHPSRGATTAERSSIGVRQFVDLASEYKSLCAKRQHPTVKPRAMVVNALRTLSSTLLARGACDDIDNTPAKLDVSALFLSDADVSVLLETLSRLGAQQHLLLDLRLNPLLTPAAYECLSSRVLAPPRTLHSLRIVDLSCAGVAPNAVRMLAAALREQGAMARVTHLNISKNGVGRENALAADAVSKLILSAASLEVLDLSLNLLQSGFLPSVVSGLDRAGEDIKHCSLRSLDLHLNNRKMPSALLEVEDVGTMIEQFRRLFELLPALETVDVRACGASSEMRRRLRELASGFDSFAQNIVTVSPAIHDDL